MAGIYIHIPFCKQACHYCNFHFSTSWGQKEEMASALVQELILKAPHFREPIETIYLGGGTPSLLQAAEISLLLESIYRHFSVTPTPEITLEANPDDISPEKANEWFKAGINRLSIGIQSFDSSVLHWMNRAHSGEQALNCIEHVRKAGFDNFSIDLIYGTPQQSIEDWQKDLSLVFDLAIPHVSCYALTVEEKTVLHHFIQSRKRENVNPDHQADCFQLLTKEMLSNGYQHYEISNFCLPGLESKHNKSYWEGKPYLGIGPSAHSHTSNTRSWNISNNALYIQSIKENKIPEETEVLSKQQQLNEYIMTGLRTSEGIEKKKITDRWGDDVYSTLNSEIAAYVKSGKIMETNTSWKLSEEGKFLADGIAASLFIV